MTQFATKKKTDKNIFNKYRPKINERERNWQYY